MSNPNRRPDSVCSHPVFRFYFQAALGRQPRLLKHDLLFTTTGSSFTYWTGFQPSDGALRPFDRTGSSAFDGPTSLWDGLTGLGRAHQPWTGFAALDGSTDPRRAFWPFPDLLVCQRTITTTTTRLSTTAVPHVGRYKRPFSLQCCFSHVCERTGGECAGFVIA